MIRVIICNKFNLSVFLLFFYLETLCTMSRELAKRKINGIICARRISVWERVIQTELPPKAQHTRKRSGFRTLQNLKLYYRKWYFTLINNFSLTLERGCRCPVDVTDTIYSIHRRGLSSQVFGQRGESNHINGPL